MLTTTLRLRRVAWGHRLMSAAIALGLLLVFGFSRKAAAQFASAPADPPLNFGTNYFVTGDYVVAGAYGMTTNISNGFATGTINVPDANPAIKKGPPGNPGITGVTQVPPGAQIVEALLYWQTVEKTSATPGSSDTGQKGLFGPLIGGVPQLYPISGLSLPSHSTVSFSNGGCSGGSTGKLVRTYRTDVRGYLPMDANGNVLANSTYQVRLPSSSSTTPITLGATLVLIYRVISPAVPLNSIVIYDGAFAPSSTTTLTMSQPVHGFYDADTTPKWRVTHIVGSGQANKFETASLNNVPLPNLYSTGQPFPGWYGSWDNTTWTYGDPLVPLPNNPVLPDDALATTMVVPRTNNAGCVSWSAVIFSTTVNDPEKDGILKTWKDHLGYTDFATGQPVDLTGAAHDQQDVFIQLDHVVDSNNINSNNGDFTPDPLAVSDVTNAFLAHGVHLHISGGNAIPEPACTDNPNATPPLLCPYPNQTGITTWRDGFELIKNQPLNYATEAQCEANSPPLVSIGPTNCVRRFPPAQRNSHHYVVFGDTLGAPNWGLLGGGLTDSNMNVPGVVAQSGTTVTFYTSRGHGLTPDPLNTHVPNGRVTIANAMTNPSLNGTYLVQSVSCKPNPDTHAGNDCSDSNRALGPYSFTITIGNARMANYTLQTDPYIAVASGQARAGSGFSDVGGPGTLVTLGQWGALATLRAKEGTLLHELGHTLGLLHGGGDNENCKSNYQSVMSYFFQSKLLGPNGVLDFSSQQLNPLDENNLGPITTTDSSPIAFSTTRWYDKQTFATVNGNLVAVGATPTHRCDGTPLSIIDPLTGGYKGGTNSPSSEISIPWLSSPFDINFDGKAPGNEPHPFKGYNDWAQVDLRQVGAGGNEFFSVPGGFVPGGPGGFVPGGPGGFVPGGPGGFVPGGPGGFIPGGPGGFVPGGPGAPVEIDSATSISVTDPPGTLTASEEPSPRLIDLSWPQSADTTDHYNIYRSSDNGATFSLLPTHAAGTPAPPPNSTGVTVTFQDTVTCNPNGYKYFVTAVVLNNTVSQESTPTNTVSIGSDGKLTGCYVVSSFSSPANAVQGSSVQVTWTLTDDFNTVGQAVTRKAANTSLVAIGPVPNTCAAGRTTILLNGTPQSGVDGFTNVANQFTFTWNNTDAFCAGSYTFQLTLDSGQILTTASALQLQIDVTDTDSTPHISTTSLLNATVGAAYNNQLTQDGGVGSVTWSVPSGTLPPGISLSSSGLLSGTTCTKGPYTFTAKVTDSAGNVGMQNLTLTVLAAPVAQVNQPTAPETSAPGVASGIPLTVNGTGFNTCSAVQWNGSALTTALVSPTRLTTTIPSGDVATAATASINVANPGSASSNVDFFQITNSTAGNVFLSPAGTATAVGAHPVGLISAIFNGDGKPDLAVANSGDNTLSILLGNGDGTFTAKPTLATGSGPFSLIAGDFNNDGELDLAVANFASGNVSNVSIFIGNGEGTFQPGVTYAVGGGPIWVVTGDFNGDGKLDLAVSNQNDHTVSILLGNGNGTFQSQVAYAGGVAGTLDVADVAIGDFNGDAKLDLAVTNPSTDQVSILLGNGDGTFQPPVAYSTGAAGSHPIAVGAADFNGDGKLDLAVTNLNTRNVAIFLGNGNGTFTLKGSYSTTIGNMIGPSAIATGDFDGDGKVDLAITDQVDNSVSILVGNGDGSFQSPQEVNTGNFAAGVAAGDFNGDGRLDVAVANSTDGTVSVMLQAPRVQLLPSPITFQTAVTVGSSSAPQPVTLTNTGSAALTISGIAFTGSNPGDFSQTNNCPTSPSTLAAGANCTISVTFTPTTTGPRNATLTITDNASDSPQNVSVSGTGS
jgi:hypothetical protein